MNRTIEVIISCVVGGLVVWLLMSKLSVLKETASEKQKKLLESEVMNLNKELLPTLAVAKLWEDRTHKLEDTMTRERKAFRIVYADYRKTKSQPVKKLTQKEQDSITNSIVSIYKGTHDTDNSFDASWGLDVVFKAAEDGTKCDSVLEAQKKLVDDGERLQAVSDSTIARKDSVIELQKQKTSKTDSLYQNQVGLTEKEKKAKHWWQVGAFGAFALLVLSLIE